MRLSDLLPPGYYPTSLSYGDSSDEQVPFPLNGDFSLTMADLATTPQPTPEEPQPAVDHTQGAGSGPPASDPGDAFGAVLKAALGH
ncbi:MAG: hypothetical protein ACPGVG_02035 [Mycobacterium sp.]